MFFRGLACHNSTVSAATRFRSGRARAGALALASFGCTKSGVECVPPPANLVCPDGRRAELRGDVFPNVFVPVCDNCHAPGRAEANRPLTTYQQIYGTNGTEARAIFNQVFESCLMPPSNAPEPLTDDERQTLLDWFACGALDDSPDPSMLRRATQGTLT